LKEEIKKEMKKDRGKDRREKIWSKGGWERSSQAPQQGCVYGMRWKN